MKYAWLGMIHQERRIVFAVEENTAPVDKKEVDRENEKERVTKLVTWQESDVHEDVREAVDLPEDDKLDAYVTKQRARVKALNIQLGLVEYAEGKRGNRHPERFRLIRKGNKLYMANSEEGKNALNGGTTEEVSPEDFGF